MLLKHCHSSSRFRIRITLLLFVVFSCNKELHGVTWRPIRNLTPSGRHSRIVFGILPRETLFCGGMSFSHLQSCLAWVLASLADLCLIGWSCSVWLQATPLVTGVWVKPKPSRWPAMLCLTCFFLQPHLGHSPLHSTPVSLAGIGSCPCPTAPSIRAFPYSAPSLQ